jgi:hypothetical protein
MISNISILINKRFCWIQSILAGPIIFFLVILISPEMRTLNYIKQNFVGLVIGFLSSWALCFVMVWSIHALAKFLVRRFHNANGETGDIHEK